MKGYAQSTPFINLSKNCYHLKTSPMAQLERSARTTESPQTPRTSPISGHLLMAEQKAHMLPTQGMFHEEEADLQSSNSKKSVLSKVKEGAIKLKHSLSGRRKHENEQTSPTRTPSPSASPISILTAPRARSAPQNDCTADRQLDEDPEYLGAPMYESEAAPESLKESARQHPRAEPVLPESHKFPSTTISTTTEATSEAIQKTTSKILGLIASTRDSKQETYFPAHTENAAKEIESSRPAQITAVPENTEDSNQYGASSLQKQDKGALEKEHSTNKLQPQEEQSAISQKQGTADSGPGVVDKVKGAVYSMLDMGHQKPSKSKTETTNSSSENIPSSTQQKRNAVMANTANSQEVIEEQNHGKILQAN